jgi:hypothetical protein
VKKKSKKEEASCDCGRIIFAGVVAVIFALMFMLLGNQMDFGNYVKGAELDACRVGAFEAYRRDTNDGHYSRYTKTLLSCGELYREN